MDKLLILLICIFLFSCTPSKLEGKLYSCNYNKSTIYLFFKNDKTYRELFYDRGQIEITNGRYFYGNTDNKLTIGDFKLYNPELITLFNNRIIISTSFLVQGNCIKIAFDLAGSDFCKSDINSISKVIKEKLLAFP